MGNLQEAKADFDQLIRLEPNNANFISDRAVVLHLLQRNEEALSELDRALDLDPNNPYRYSSRAFLKDRTGDLEGAIVDYEKAIEMDPEDAVAYNNKGLVEEKLGYEERSKKSFEKADDLVGYTPDKPQQEAKDYIVKQEIPPQFREEKEVTLSSYLSTLIHVFNDQNTRKEFFRFLSSRFKKNK
jgi:Flp pilus assembly protein TadD